MHALKNYVQAAVRRTSETVARGSTKKKGQRTKNSKNSYEAGVEPNEGETPARQKKERVLSVLGIKPEAVTSDTLSHRLMNV